MLRNWDEDAVGKSQTTINAVGLADLGTCVDQIKGELQLSMRWLSLPRKKNTKCMVACRVIGGRTGSYFELLAVERSTAQLLPMQLSCVYLP